MMMMIITTMIKWKFLTWRERGEGNKIREFCLAYIRDSREIFEEGVLFLLTSFNLSRPPLTYSF